MYISPTHRTLPLFVWHRRNWDIVYPWVELEDSELTDLSMHGSYVAGFTDPAIEGRTDLYDLFVNGKTQPFSQYYCSIYSTCTCKCTYMYM